MRQEKDASCLLRWLGRSQGWNWHSAVEQPRIGHHPRAELAECLTPMAHGRLARPIDLAECAAVRRVIEDGVVPESMRAARFPRNLARNDANRFREDRAAIRKRHVRNESCRARRQSARLQLAIDGGE